MAEITRFREHARGRAETRRRSRAESRLREIVSERLMGRLERTLAPGELEAMVGRVAARAIDPYTAADLLVSKAFTG